jgi:hypothetical protein
MPSPDVPPRDCQPLDGSNPLALVCPTHGLEKFDAMVDEGWLKIVYRDGPAVVYEVSR